jgi:hypothetical protein
MDLFPTLLRQEPLHQPGDLLIALQELQRHPFLGVWLRHAIGDEALELLQHRPMVLSDLRTARRIGRLAPGQPRDRLDQLRQAPALGGYHRDHGQAKRGLQDMRLDAQPLLLGHIHHVQGQYHRRGEGQQLRYQVEVPLQGRGIDDGHHHIGPLLG